MHTRVTRMLGIDLPIIQGGLAYLARAELAAAVSNAGGLGQITATTLAGAEALAAEIRRARELTSRPFGVNLAIGHRPLDDLLDVVRAERVPVVSLTGGNPAPYVDAVKRSGAVLMVLVAGVREAEKAERLGADVIIAVGAEGGGHIGRHDTGTMVLVRRVVESVAVPVVASGGIADGRGLAAALALGAEGIEMGTRFVATQECPAHDNYKTALVAAREFETLVIERTIGRPGRVLPSPYVTQLLDAEARGAGIEELRPWVAGEVNRRAALEGALEAGFVWAGQAAGLIRHVPSVAELLSWIRTDADEALAALCRQWCGAGGPVP